MGYRRVTYLEQIWYLIKYGLKHGFGPNEKRKNKKNAVYQKFYKLM